MGNVLSFEKYKEEFYAEFDEYYSTYPIDVEKEIGKRQGLKIVLTF